MSLPTTAPDYIVGKIIDLFTSPKLLDADSSERKNYVIELPYEGIKLYIDDDAESTAITNLRTFKPYGVILADYDGSQLTIYKCSFLNKTYTVNAINSVTLGGEIGFLEDSLIEDDVFLFVTNSGYKFKSTVDYSVMEDFEIDVDFSCVISSTTKKITKIKTDTEKLYYYINSEWLKVHDSTWTNSGYKTLTANKPFVIKDEDAIKFLDENKDV